MKKKLKQTGKFILNHLFGFIIGAIVFSIIGVKAADYLLSSQDVSYDNSSSGESVSTVKGALDLLNQKASAITTSFSTYTKGDSLTLNNELYYVIADSDANQDFVTLLKAKPLTVAEVNEYGEGHINRYTNSSVGTAHSHNGYGEMAYYSSENCGWIDGSYVVTGCINDYNQSEIKYAVDAWANDKFKNNELAMDSNGYSSRLITIDELLNLEWVLKSISDKNYWPISGNFDWIHRIDDTALRYWTMTPTNMNYTIYSIHTISTPMTYNEYTYSLSSVRPVINVYKSKLNNS